MHKRLVFKKLGNMTYLTVTSSIINQSWISWRKIVRMSKDSWNIQASLYQKLVQKFCIFFFLPKTTPLESNKYLQLLLHSQWFQLQIDFTKKKYFLDIFFVLYFHENVIFQDYNRRLREETRERERFLDEQVRFFFISLHIHTYFFHFFFFFKSKFVAP